MKLDPKLQLGMIAGDRRSLARVLAAQQEANPAEIGNFSIRRTQLVFAWKIAFFPQMKKVEVSRKKEEKKNKNKALLQLQSCNII